MNIKGNNRQRREYLLSGLIRCYKCGAAFHGVTRTSGEGYETPYYICSAKHNKKSCDALNINGHELDTLVVAVLKRELLNPEFIERTADKIMEIASSVTGDKNEKTNSINKELVTISTGINNLTKVLLSGFDSEAVREKLTELKVQKQALIETLRTLEHSSDKEIDRGALVEQLTRDANIFADVESDRTREIIQKYVSTIRLSDTTVEITGMSDKYVSNSTCGGRI